MALFMLHWGVLFPVFILAPSAFLISEWFIPSPNIIHLILRIIITVLLGALVLSFTWMATLSAVPTWKYAVYSFMNRKTQETEARNHKRFDRACKKTWDGL